MASAQISEVIQYLERRAPVAEAEDWDNVGLLVGNPQNRVTGAVVSIDLTPEAIQTALKKKFNLIITHHPCIFSRSGGVSQLLAGDTVYEAARSGLSVACWHTNFDRCSFEVVKKASSALGVRPLGRFEEPDQLQPSARELGYGFWGDYKTPKTFKEIAKRVKEVFQINGFWITNPAPSLVKRVGFVAGKGASFVKSASDLGVDLLITGEAGYHTVLAGSKKNTAVMELGHRESERFFIEIMGTWLSQLGLGFEGILTPTQKIWLGGP